MTRELPAMAPFAELVRLATRAASARVVEGSRRNARAALDARREMLRHGSEALATLPTQPSRRDMVDGEHRRPTA
jgi:hypothetical protein